MLCCSRMLQMLWHALHYTLHWTMLSSPSILSPTHVCHAINKSRHSIYWERVILLCTLKQRMHRSSLPLCDVEKKGEQRGGGGEAANCFIRHYNHVPRCAPDSSSFWTSATLWLTPVLPFLQGWAMKWVTESNSCIVWKYYEKQKGKIVAYLSPVIIILIGG